eukprot:scaffold488_cov142-Skeletonema_menzelii.AAC.7
MELFGSLVRWWLVGWKNSVNDQSEIGRFLKKQGRRRSRHGIVELVCDGVTTVSREMPHDNKRHEHIHHEDSASIVPFGS